MNYEKQNKKITRLQEEIKNLEYQLGILKELKHEAAKLHDEIQSLSEELNTLIQNEQNSENKRKKELSSTILHTSSILLSRIAYSDLELNPSGMSKLPKHNAVIYQKFDKARYILLNKASEKKIHIKFNGNTRYKHMNTIRAFDCIPYILLDNAIKYAPAETEVNVTFTPYNIPTTKTQLEVTIESIGPMIEKEDLALLVNKGFRSNNVKDNYPGDGLGLYISNQLCRLHDVKLTLNSDNENITTILNGIKFSNFCARLIFFQQT